MRNLERNKEIIRRIRAGESAKTLAAAYGVHPQAIYVVLRQMEHWESLPQAQRELSVRTVNCLLNAGIDVNNPETIAELTISEVLELPNFGKKSADELQRWLRQNGLDFKAQ